MKKCKLIVIPHTGEFLIRTNVLVSRFSESIHTKIGQSIVLDLHLTSCFKVPESEIQTKALTDIFGKLEG